MILSWQWCQCNFAVLVRVMRAILKHVPSWNMFWIGMVCCSEKCAFLKHVSDWHRADFVISRADDNMSFLTITFEVALFLLLKNKQTNAAWPYFWSLFTNFYASGPCIYHATSIWQSLHGTNLKHVSEMHIFKTAHHAVLKHVSGWHMFQNGTQHMHAVTSLLDACVYTLRIRFVGKCQ